jgi:CubicO group peptidase (beta-lactamase class C family)
MTTPDTLTDGKRLTYGFGLAVADVDGHHVITHSGGINGYTTSQMYFPAESLSVIMFTNTDNRGPDFTALNIARAVLGLPLAVRGPNRPTH